VNAIVRPRAGTQASNRGSGVGPRSERRDQIRVGMARAVDRPPSTTYAVTRWTPPCTREVSTSPAEIASHSSRECGLAVRGFEPVRHSRGECWAISSGLDDAHHSRREYKALSALTATLKLAAWRAGGVAGSTSALAPRVHGGLRGCAGCAAPRCGVQRCAEQRCGGRSVACGGAARRCGGRSAACGGAACSGAAAHHENPRLARTNARIDLDLVLSYHHCLSRPTLPAGVLTEGRARGQLRRGTSEPMLFRPGEEVSAHAAWTSVPDRPRMCAAPRPAGDNVTSRSRVRELGRRGAGRSPWRPQAAALRRGGLKATHPTSSSEHSVPRGLAAA
jgi:hypothetical protein